MKILAKKKKNIANSKKFLVEEKKKLLKSENFLMDDNAKLRKKIDNLKSMFEKFIFWFTKASIDFE